MRVQLARRFILASALVSFLSFLAGCATRQAMFAVLPNPDGGSGAITVDDGQKSMLLDKPYAASQIMKGSAEPMAMDETQVQQIFGAALAARPIAPNHFRLYFENDSDTMTSDSEQQYRSVFDDIKKRPVYEVEVVGHTDTTGELKHNQELSLTRAGAIREKLIHDGLDPKSISIAGRGPLDLRVKTGPNVPEPLNRRVEITVR
jgi:outer membrane protein OmpA-like peptidoglycan-associated protein